MPDFTRLTVNRDYASVQTRRADYNARDSKGRQIGSLIECVTALYVASDEGGLASRGILDGRIVNVPGTFFEYRAWATRNGLPYGATQAWRAFRTKEERDKAIETYVAGAQRRANKKVER